MSALRVMWPDEDLAQLGVFSEESVSVLAFEPATKAPSRNAFDVIERARLIYDNRSCPTCNYPVVEPIELANGVRNRKGMMIPGTSTLVGFRCRGCRCEWST